MLQMYECLTPDLRSPNTHLNFCVAYTKFKPRYAIAEDILFLHLLLPDFKPWRTKYESVNYGISNYWST